MMKECQSPTLTLLNAPRIGKGTVHQLWREHKPLPTTIKELLELLSRAPKIGNRVPSFSDLRSANERAHSVLVAARAKCVGVLTLDDSQFPARLAEIPNPPVVLFWRGNPAPLAEETSVAVIGTRRPTEFGLQAAYSLGKTFAEAGFVVVSGLALGCDAAAHNGCLDGHGKTIAVLANGLDRVYPKRNEPLAQRILDNGGCLLTEYAPEVPARPAFFIERDRLQSGLGAAVIAVETDEHGGSIRTVGFGREQGKPIAAVLLPDHARSEKSRGNEKLIQAQQATALGDQEALTRFIGYLCERGAQASYKT
jgi:DNA processing protein